MPNELKISHLALFNVGSYGNDYGKTQDDFLMDVERASSFSKAVDIPLVTISSNFNCFYNNKKDRIFHFSPRSTVCLITAVLSLQKLFKFYFISSTSTIEDIKLNKYDQYYYEQLITSFLSNANSNIYIANGNLSRVEKIKYIADNKLVAKQLYVCAADIYNNAYGTNFN